MGDRVGTSLQPVAGGTVVVVFDGGSIGNPGKGYGSFQITWPDGSRELIKLEYPEYGRAMTNNQAEYETLIRALQYAVTALGSSVSATAVSIEGDSQLVLNQLDGSWKVKKPKLMPLHAKATRLAHEFASFKTTWHPRSRSVRILGH